MSRERPRDDGGTSVASAEAIAARALDASFSGPLAGVRRRIYLTYRYLGWRTLLYRAVTFPLRFTPLERRLRLRARASDIEYRQAIAWYAEHGRPVDIVIPSYRDADQVGRLVRSIRATVPGGMARVIVADDAAGEEHLAALRSIAGIDVISGERNEGFAANVNRGLRASTPDRDVVVLNSDVEAQRGWLACLQYAASTEERVGVVGGRLLYPDGRIQSAGSVRNAGAPEWFDHRYRFKPENWGPAEVPGPALAVTGACMYITRAALERLDGFDERFAMAYEDVDLCLRAWRAGLRVLYFPAATMYHLESVTRGTELGARERASQDAFWGLWEKFFDDRDVRTPDRHLRIVYVTEGTGVGGGHRDIFEHLNRLLDRGHDVALYTLGEPPEWFDLRAPVRRFADYDELEASLSELDAIKVATWWMTAPVVFAASVARGLPVYFVQDIETSYYADDERARHAVLDSYRPEFRYMTISGWNRERLHELGLDAELIPPGIDLATFRPCPDLERREDMVLALGRANPLKNLPLTLAAWRRVRGQAPAGRRPELCLFGVEPEVADEEGIRYVLSPDDEQVNELFCEATVFVQTSTHEGFALPPLEAMATGAAVVCTDAHGNRDFCTDGLNCLIPDAQVGAVAGAIRRLLDDPELRARLGRAGVDTARGYAWDLRIDELEDFFARVAASRELALAGELLPRPDGQEKPA